MTGSNSAQLSRACAIKIIHFLWECSGCYTNFIVTHRVICIISPLALVISSLECAEDMTDEFTQNGNSSSSSWWREWMWLVCSKIEGLSEPGWRTKAKVISTKWKLLSVSDSLHPHGKVRGILQATILEWPFPSPGCIPNPGIEPRSPALQVDSLPAELPGKPKSKVGTQKLCSSITSWCLWPHYPFLGLICLCVVVLIAMFIIVALNRSSYERGCQRLCLGEVCVCAHTRTHLEHKTKSSIIFNLEHFKMSNMHGHTSKKWIFSSLQPAGF